MRPRWFRPPYGVLSAGTLRGRGRGSGSPRCSGRRGAGTGSGRPGASGVAAARRPGLRPGGTLLLHDSDCTSTPGSWRATAAALPLLAAELDRRGLPSAAARAPPGADDRRPARPAVSALFATSPSVRSTARPPRRRWRPAAAAPPALPPSGAHPRLVAGQRAAAPGSCCTGWRSAPARSPSSSRCSPAGWCRPRPRCVVRPRHPDRPLPRRRQWTRRGAASRAGAVPASAARPRRRVGHGDRPRCCSPAGCVRASWASACWRGAHDRMRGTAPWRWAAAGIGFGLTGVLLKEVVGRPPTSWAAVWPLVRLLVAVVARPRSSPPSRPTRPAR